MRRILILFVVTFLAISGYAEQVDIESEKAKVQSVLEMYLQAIETEDMELISKIFAHDDDMVNFGLEAEARFIGWEPLKEDFQILFESAEDTDISVRDQVIKVHASGSVAWFSEILDLNLLLQGEPGSLEGTIFTGVLEKRDGNWVIIQFHLSYR